MTTLFKTQDSSITLKAYDHQVAVYPGMHVLLNGKEYVVQYATLTLDTDEVTVVVKRYSKEQ